MILAMTNFKPRVCFNVGVALLGLLVMPFATALAETPLELVKKADARRGLQGSFSFNVKTQFQDKAEKNNQEYSVKVRDVETSLVEQVAPARAHGRKLLMKGFDMWLFTPQVKKAVRIGLQQRLTGDVANGDISRTNYAQDYRPTVVGKDAANGAVILDLKANDKRATYDRIKYWIEEKSAKPVKAEFYALSGKLMKTALFTDFKKIDGLDRMTKVTIQDAVVKTRKTVLIYSGHKVRSFSDSEFNKEQMDR